MSRAYRPPHRNPKTAEWLENKEQVCPACFENFGTTEAGDAHRVGEFGLDRRCILPSEARLIPVHNQFNTVVWVKDESN